MREDAPSLKATGGGGLGEKAEVLPFDMGLEGAAFSGRGITGISCPMMSYTQVNMRIHGCSVGHCS